jgi:hypothetical protein
MTFEPVYRLYVNRTDGPGHSVEFDTEEKAREAFAGAQGGTFNLRVELRHYANYNDKGTLLAEWTRPSIFNLEN